MPEILSSRCLRTACFVTLLSGHLVLRSQERAIFQVKPLGGQSTFHVGERIPLELSFSSAVKDRFEINMASYDRSGRMRYEEFELAPGAGWSDPLARYYSAGYIGGGMSSTGILESKPTKILLDLNEWVRFDQPGDYHVTVRSHRLIDLTQKRVFNGDPPEPVAAEAFTLRIIPATPAWQAAKFRAARAQLAAVPAVEGQPPQERKSAIADLRFLGTKAAIEELAADLREDRPDLMHQSALGLMGVPEAMREVALQAMEQKLEDPVFPVCGWFLEAMAVLDTHSGISAEADLNERSRSRENVRRLLLAALPRKTGKARAETVQTILSSPPADLDAESRKELGKVLGASFLDLSEEQRAQQLTWQWDLLRSDAMLPLLRDAARLPLSRPGSNEVSNYSRRELKSIALSRWYQMDPTGALQEVELQIGSAKPALTAQALAFLPEQSLPQFEPTWAQALAESEGSEQEAVLGGLLVRFGTGSAAAQVGDKLAAKIGHWACAPQAAALAYLVKFDPEQARPLLQQAADANGPGKTGCYQDLFQSISAHASGEVLTAVAVASLDNQNPRVAMDALIYLADHGRKEDQKPIWDRYVKWHERWAGRGDVLDSQDRASMDQTYLEIGLGQILAQALIANQGWLADQDLIARVTKLCVGRQVCQLVEQVTAEGAVPYQVSAFRNASSESYRVGQYTAKTMELLNEKIAQYPKGTKFQLSAGSPQNEDQKSLEHEVQAIFEKNGMSLEPALP